MRRTSICHFAFLAAIAPVSTAFASVELLSHRANYQLQLHEASQASGMEAVRGLLVMETREGCEGHVSNQELAFVAQLVEGPDFNYAVRFSSWESPTLDRLRFTVTSFDNGQVFEEYEGSAALEGTAGQANYNKPEDVSIDLPAGTIFPTEHMKRLVESAANGQMVVNSHVFDGSGPDALTSVTAVIGQARAVADDRSELAGETTWPVSLGYYSLDGANDLPEFQISFNMTADGVLHDIVLDYGDFALAGELVEIETFDKPDCR